MDNQCKRFNLPFLIQHVQDPMGWVCSRPLWHCTGS